MAITKVRVKINGTWTTLSQNSSTGKWSTSITAPSTTSYNLANQYYPVTVEITNDAGTVATYESTDATFGEDLRLVVKETIKPKITLVSPSNSAYVTNNKQKITFKVTDESSGSGVKLSAVKLKIDSTTYSYNSTGMTYSAITNGYQFVFTPRSALADGKHTITINASDNDGNAAKAVSANFTIDTVPPTLTISNPTSGKITNNPALTIEGVTNDSTSSPVEVTVLLNGSDVGDVTVGSDGSFSKAVTLAEGTNSIVVTSTDYAGQSTSITLSVKLDTSVPTIKSISMSPNPANASASIAITLEVE